MPAARDHEVEVSGPEPEPRRPSACGRRRRRRRPAAAAAPACRTEAGGEPRPHPRTVLSRLLVHLPCAPSRPACSSVPAERRARGQADSSLAHQTDAEVKAVTRAVLAVLALASYLEHGPQPASREEGELAAALRLSLEGVPADGDPDGADGGGSYSVD